MQTNQVAVVAALPARIDLEVAAPLPSLNNMREHPMARADRVALVHTRVLRVLSEQPLQPFQLLNAVPGRVLIVRLYRLAPKPLDDDNLASSLKAARDAVAHWLGVDDRKHLRVRYFVYQAKRPKVVEPKTGRQQKDRVYQTLRIEAFPVTVHPPLGATLEGLKAAAEHAAMMFDAAESVSKDVRAAGDLEAALGVWLGIDSTIGEKP